MPQRRGGRDDPAPHWRTEAGWHSPPPKRSWRTASERRKNGGSWNGKIERKTVTSDTGEPQQLGDAAPSVASDWSAPGEWTISAVVDRPVDPKSEARGSCAPSRSREIRNSPAHPPPVETSRSGHRGRGKATKSSSQTHFRLEDKIHPRNAAHLHRKFEIRRGYRRHHRGPVTQE